jgi:L-alanine-DL-glutamate epimerase-like enolase superfamily enzyme
MKLASLELTRLEIPFRVPFRHASAERRATESAWVEARSVDGHLGHGESCPRTYVTGEDLDTARAFLARHGADLIRDVAAVGDVVRWVDERRADVDANPAAWCAIELALLDLLAREEGRSVEAILGLPELQGTFHYSAVIGDGDGASVATVVARYRALGFTDYKLKLCGDLARDREKIACIGCQGRLRLDANNLWSTAAEAAAYLRALDHPIFALEEPLGPNQHAALARLAASTGTRIIVDESFLRAEQLRLAGPREQWIINLRVSKMGGLVRSLRVVAAARRRGIPVVVGAQVGETSLLTRAALTVARQARDLLIAQEGAFGPLLLETDVCDPPLMFGRGGRLTWEASGVAGFGLTIARPRQRPGAPPSTSASRAGSTLAFTVRRSSPSTRAVS